MLTISHDVATVGDIGRSSDGQLGRRNASEVKRFRT